MRQRLVISFIADYSSEGVAVKRGRRVDDDCAGSDGKARLDIELQRGYQLDIL